MYEIIDVVSSHRVAAGVWSAEIGDVGRGAECLDCQRVLKDYARRMLSRIPCVVASTLVWYVQSSRKACLVFDVVGCLLVC